MRALVTGGAGFLGRYIVEKLLKRGWDVVSLSRNHHPEILTRGVTTIRADIRDRLLLTDLFEKFDVVFHTAAHVGIYGKYEDFYETNVTGTRNVISACVINSVKRLIYTSSPSVTFRGKPEEWADETAPFPKRFNSYYAKTKAIAEWEVRRNSGRLNMLSCAIRPHLIWGPRDTNLIPRLLARADEGKLAIVGDGKNLVDMSYVENVADAHIVAMEELFPGSPAAGSVYLISQGEPVNLWDWTNKILKRLGRPPVTKRIPYPLAYAAGAAYEAHHRWNKIYTEPPMTRFLAQQLAMPHYYNIGKAQRELGFKARISSDEGLERLAKSLGY
ncbi:MAG: NAD-dependent epimerase/dehydratase family protein [Nitrospinae bacterium]|nr:NAD-dependent epimerase/dehydratase family protein [Nitrospinota bacterium]MBF0634997.1 NAD-dependent epimerase/dehydratase family protein [Nitrospinota bacterium]